MAQEDGSSWWGSWTTGILENVRHKTSSALEFVQNDLSEFVTTIQRDTSVAIADSAKAVNSNLKIEESHKDEPTGKFKQGVSNLLTSISSKLDHAAAESTANIPCSSDNEYLNRQTTSVVYDRMQARLQEIQTNPETYRNDPDSDAYQNWCERFDLDGKKGEISELLVNNPDIRRLYTKFVPIIQSHSTFWHRYFYKVYEIEMENKRLADIVARASQKEEQDLGWDDEDEEDFNAVKDTPEGEVCNQGTTTSSSNSHVVPDTATNPEQKSDNNKCQQSHPEIDTITDEEHVNKESDNKKTLELSLGKDTADQLSDHQSPCTPQTFKSEEEKSDSSDSNSWVRVSDKEGSSTNSSSSVILVNEKEKDQELAWDDSDGENNIENNGKVDIDDDDDDEFDLNEDIPNEDVEKLVQSITANELESDEEDWDNWE